MAENGVNGHHSSTSIVWKVGIMNNSNKYLTAETFGYKVNADGAALKKKQIWIIEQEPTDNMVYIKSSQNRYMSADKYGTVTVEAEERGELEKFQVEYSPDGKWAFKNVANTMYFSGSGDNVRCFSKTPSENNWWSIQLYIHPQVHLRNAKRLRYAQMNGDKLECSENVPWGPEALVFLDFDNGKYTLKSFDNRYLNREGELVDSANADCQYTMEIHAGCLAFKDIEGRYLTAVGTGALKCKSKKVTKDECFTIEDSHPQVHIISANKKRVSTRLGVDVSANQTDEIDNTEVFQMEYNKDKENWAFLGRVDRQPKYWNLQPQPLGTVQATRKETQNDSFFEIDWQEDGTVGIKGNDDKYLSNKQTGILYSHGSSLEDQCKFRIVIVNRPNLVLKSEFGFVGLKSNQFICNKAKYDILKLEYVEDDGYYTIQGGDGSYWSVGKDNIVVPDSTPSKFQLQFCGNSMLAIRAPNGCYLQGEQNGLFKATSNELNSTSWWEF